VSIEKAFEIRGAAPAIWDALWADLAQGEGFEIAQSTWPKLLALRLKLAGVPCTLTYRIEAMGDACEVSAMIEPRGFRYTLNQVLSFGHQRRNFEIMLTIGLANLKASVEGTALAEPEAEP
jgi:hypothetical protein